MTAFIKICGLKTPELVDAALDAGAAMIGFVHCVASPRHLSTEQMAPLIAQVRHRAKSVIVCVNPSDAEILEFDDISPDYIQIHKLPSPDRLDEIRKLTRIPLIAAKSIASAADVDAAKALAAHADMLVLDAKAPADSAIPGGNGVPFDWSLLKGFSLENDVPWMLSGGLSPENVAEAIAATGAKWVDVSSGVEYEAGIKNPDAIRQFIENVHVTRA